MIVKLLTEHHLEFLSLKGGCRGSSESKLVKMSNCWKSQAAAQICRGSYIPPSRRGPIGSQVPYQSLYHTYQFEHEISPDVQGLYGRRCYKIVIP